MNNNRICQLFGIQYPIIQAGMIWCSGHELASAVSNAGGLGIIGAGSMYPEVLRNQIRKCRAATDRPFAVNLPLIYPHIAEHMETVISEGVPIVFTSAGSPATWAGHLRANGIKMVHVVANSKFAQKAEAAGADAVVAEGFEAGGHNGREETSTMVLVPLVCRAVRIPVIAAGGIGSGRAMLAAFALGAEGVQVGSRFVATPESSAHQAFKDAVIEAKEGDTLLSLKKLVPVRLLRNRFFTEIKHMEDRGASNAELAAHLGRARAKRGMFEGDMADGELEIGQVAAAISGMTAAAGVVREMVDEYNAALGQLQSI